MGKRAIGVYLRFLTLLATGVVVILTFYALTGGDQTPIGHTFHACMVVLLPFFIVLDLVALVYWLIRRRWVIAVLTLLPLIFCWNYVQTMVQLRSERTSMGHDNVLTVGTYNVHMFSSDGSGFIASDIMQALARENCDVVCLQEYSDPVSGDNSTVRARVRGLYEYSAVGEGNMAIFSRYPIRAHKDFRFDYSNNGWQWADIEVGEGHLLRVYNVHMETTGINSALHQMAKENADIDINDIPMDPDALDNSEEDRTMFNSRVNNDRVYRLLLGNYVFGLSVRSGQAITVANAKLESPHPIILAGDFNDVPYSFTYKMLKGDLVDGFVTGGHGLSSTYRGARGVFRIDYVFSDASIACFDYHTLDLTYSDHNPVVARFDLVPHSK